MLYMTLIYIISISGKETNQGNDYPYVCLKYYCKPRLNDTVRIRLLYGPYDCRNIGRRNTDRKVTVYGPYCLGIPKQYGTVLLRP